MDPLDNPFVPGAGTQPPELAGRSDVLQNAKISMARVAKGTAARSQILVGLRGVGKTVLLNRIREIAEDSGYYAVLLEAHEDKNLPALLVPPLRKILLQLDRPSEQVSHKAKQGLRALRSFLGVVKLKGKVGDIGEIELGIEPALGVADSGDLEHDLSDLFVAIGEAAKERGASVSLLIDELQYLTERELSALIMALHQVAQRNLPLIFVGAGLPQVVGNAGKAKSYAERLFTFPSVGALARADAINALRTPVRVRGIDFSDEALDFIVEKTEGYPYFLQQWGHDSWNIAGDTLITKYDAESASATAIRSLDESFFRVRLDRLTKREKDYTFAMETLGCKEMASGDIAEKMGVSLQTVAPLRSSLIKKGMIYSPSFGVTAFTVPLFDDFLRRQRRL